MVCFQCGIYGHRKEDCPLKLNPKNARHEIQVKEGMSANTNTKGSHGEGRWWWSKG